MYVSTIHPGYLPTQELLSEYESILGRMGPSASGETEAGRTHWESRLPGYSAELALRGLEIPVVAPSSDPLPAPESDGIDDFERVRERGDAGRIPVPRNSQELWAQHKYSVMARDPNVYREIGRRLANTPDSEEAFRELHSKLLTTLRTTPPEGRLRNAVQHMWGYVSEAVDSKPTETSELLAATARAALDRSEPYLLHSTALSELAPYLLPR
ncbi:MAG: DUF1722 domain-containing protein [Planctomycetota bacterium]